MRKNAEIVESKVKVPTSFGPEETEQVVMKSRMIISKQKAS